MGVNGLGLTRSLGEAGVRVRAVDSARRAPELFSRYCVPLACPNPDAEPERALELLLAEGMKLERPAVLLPASDAFIRLMSRYRAQMAGRFLFALPPPAVAEGLVDKWRQHEMVAGAGILCPRTIRLASMADVARIKDDIDYPVLLKPRLSHLWAPIFGTKGFRVDGPAELESRLTEIAPSGLEVVVQAIVPGPNTSHYLVRAYVDDSNHPRGPYTLRKIRQYPTDFGDATLIETVRADDVEELGLRLLQRLQYRGLASIELKRDERTGELTFIELNARLGQNHILGTRCGVNLPLIAYLDLTGQTPAPRRAYREGVRYAVVAKDVRAFLDHSRRGELGPVQWIRSLATARVFPHFDRRDPLPFVMAVGRGLRRRLLPRVLPLTRPSPSRAGEGAAATPWPSHRERAEVRGSALCASRTPARVLHFRSTFTFAGPERSLLTLGAPLRALGIETKIIAYYRRRPPEPPIHSLLEQGRRENLDVEQWDDSSLFSWRTVRRLAHELEHGGYDLLVTHDHKANLMGYLAARRSRTACLAVAHGYDFSLSRMHLYRRIDLVTLRRFPRIVAVSDALRAELIAGGLSSARIRVIPTAIDVGRFAEGAGDRGAEWRRRWAEPGAPVVATVGRLYRQKGLTYFLESAAQIHRVAPQVRFWIAGEGVLRDRLAARIRHLGLEGVVTLLGQQRDVAAIMAASDVFVMPSLGEGLSNVLLEAMALARPVVATRVGGTPEVVRDGETGWLVPPREPAALAAAVLQVLRDPGLAARVGAQGRDLVADRFSAASVAAQMAEVYREVTAATAAHGP